MINIETIELTGEPIRDNWLNQYISAKRKKRRTFDEKDLILYFEILYEMYQKSVPSLNFIELIRTQPLKDGFIDIPINSTFIEEEKYNEILERHLKEIKNYPKWMKQRMKNTIALGASPSLKRNNNEH